MSDLTDESPPTSSQATFGIFGAPMASAKEILALSNAEVRSSSLMGTWTPVMQ